MVIFGVRIRPFLAGVSLDMSRPFPNNSGWDGRKVYLFMDFLFLSFIDENPL